jgi:hypothetical protein
MWRMLGEVHERSTRAVELLEALPCAHHSARLAVLEARAGSVRSPSNTYQVISGQLDQHAEQIEDGLTDRINLAALQAVRAAADEQAEREAARIERERDAMAAQLKLEAERRAAQLKAENDAALAAIALKHQEMELKHRRSMSRVKLFGAVLGVIVASGIFATIKGLLGTEAAQVETQKSLRRIEAKQATRSPDAGEK